MHGNVYGKIKIYGIIVYAYNVHCCGYSILSSAYSAWFAQHQYIVWVSTPYLEPKRSVCVLFHAILGAISVFGWFKN